ncbi:hypothetical protein JHN55_11795 [Streptomyces sp. MBT56]|uniref:hypothetical protein n=1 Tax=unclassified Streptomyces TaxID=2593676 RepID=UPI00190CB0CC|nr:MULTISPECIES: hypothetical protein [unclassified Streptomyces]MBK3557200.1 hypothetical protein [Streptomyces sp. MBT56]MBK3600361.1 hypothetical protein [Streptomyces sp. MBT54]MBK3617882.1 hypothetical protein [Streptomyces sp. MBT98]
MSMETAWFAGALPLTPVTVIGDSTVVSSLIWKTSYSWNLLPVGGGVVEPSSSPRPVTSQRSTCGVTGSSRGGPSQRGSTAAHSRAHLTASLGY